MTTDESIRTYEDISSARKAMILPKVFHIADRIGHLKVALHEFEDEVQVRLVRVHVDELDDTRVLQFLQKLDLPQRRHIHTFLYAATSDFLDSHHLPSLRRRAGIPR